MYNNYFGANSRRLHPDGRAHRYGRCCITRSGTDRHRSARRPERVRVAISGRQEPAGRPGIERQRRLAGRDERSGSNGRSSAEASASLQPDSFARRAGRRSRGRAESPSEDGHDARPHRQTQVRDAPSATPDAVARADSGHARRSRPLPGDGRRRNGSGRGRRDAHDATSRHQHLHAETDATSPAAPQSGPSERQRQQENGLLNEPAGGSGRTKQQKKRKTTTIIRHLNVPCKKFEKFEKKIIQETSVIAAIALSNTLLYIYYIKKKRGVKFSLFLSLSLSFCLQCSLINVIDPVVSSF